MVHAHQRRLGRYRSHPHHWKVYSFFFLLSFFSFFFLLDYFYLYCSLHVFVKVCCRYDSYNTDVIKQHSIWMSEAGIITFLFILFIFSLLIHIIGVDSLIVDWTNNLWGKVQTLLIITNNNIITATLE